MHPMEPELSSSVGTDSQNTVADWLVKKQCEEQAILDDLKAEERSGMTFD